VIALLLCTLLAAPADAKAASALVPASARVAVLLDGDGAASGLREFLTAAGAHAAMLEPGAVGRDLQRTVGVDLLQKGPAFLARTGPRALVELNESWGLTAPVADAKAAKSALDAWLAQAGPARPTRQAPLKGPLAAGNRAGMLAPVGGGLRFLTASGKHAAALVSLLAQVGPRRADESPLSRDKTFAAAQRKPLGPAALFLRGDDPLQGALFSLEGSRTGLTARGLVVPSGVAPLFDGAAPGPCKGPALGCARASLGPAGRTLAALALRQYLGRLLPAGQRDAALRLAQRALSQATQETLRLDSLDVLALGDETDSLAALHLAASARVPDLQLDGTAPSGGTLEAHALTLPLLCLRTEPAAAFLSAPCGPGPELVAGDGKSALEATLDLSAIDAALSLLGPLDALNGTVAAGAIAAHLLWGELLEHAGPLTISGSRAGASAQVELRLPLR